MAVLVNNFPMAYPRNGGKQKFFHLINSKEMMNEVLLMQAAQVIPQQSSIVLTVKAGAAGSVRSINLNTNKTHNDVDIIGLAVRVADSADSSFSINGNKLIDATILNCAFLQIYDGTDIKIEEFPLQMLVPQGGNIYVPVDIKKYNPGSSKIVFTNAALAPAIDRDIEITLIRNC